MAQDVEVADEKTPAQTAKEWAGRIRRAQQRQKAWHPWWEAAFEAYTPSVKDNPKDYSGQVRTGRIFTIVERKSAELFYQKPDLTVSPSPLLEALGDQGVQVASAQGAIVNELLGLDGVNVRRLARRGIFDHLLFSIGPGRMGWRAYTKDTPTSVPVMDDAGQPVLDPMTGQPQTQVQVVPVTIKGEVFWEPMSPKQFVFDADFDSNDFDTCPWVGEKFRMGLIEAKREFGADKFPDDFKGSMSGDDPAFDQGDAPDKLPSIDLVTGTRIWYHACLFDEAVVHPDAIQELVFIDGIPEAVRDRPSPDQTFDAQGRLTPDSLVGYPIHPLAIRIVTDAAYTMSDVAVALPVVQELDKFREQMIDQRSATTLRYLYNTDNLPQADLEKAIAAPLGGAIGLPAAAFADINRTITAMPHGPYPRENFQFNDYIDQDLSRIHAIDATSSGTTEASVTATEANLRQANVNVRLSWEQGFVADWFVKGATKFATLVQRYLPVKMSLMYLAIRVRRIR